MALAGGQGQGGGAELGMVPGLGWGKEVPSLMLGGGDRAGVTRVKTTPSATSLAVGQSKFIQFIILVHLEITRNNSVKIRRYGIKQFCWEETHFIP